MPDENGQMTGNEVYESILEAENYIRELRNQSREEAAAEEIAAEISRMEVPTLTERMALVQRRLQEYSTPYSNMTLPIPPGGWTTATATSTPGPWTVSPTIGGVSLPSGILRQEPIPEPDYFYSSRYASTATLMGFSTDQLVELREMMDKFQIKSFHDMMLLVAKALERDYSTRTKESRVAKAPSLGLIIG